MKTKNLQFLMLASVLFCVSEPCFAEDQVPVGWRKGGATNDYEVGIDNSIRTGGKHSAYLKATSNLPKQFVNLLQAFRADDYRGKRVRLSAQVRVQGVDSAAALWMRIDSETKTLGFDNMSDRAIRSPSEWKKYAIVLDVPSESLKILFGVMFVGRGQAWVDDFKLEVVSKDIPVTRGPDGSPLPKKTELPKQTGPINLDFEN